VGINATDINVLASALDPRYKILNAEKLSKIKAEVQDQISQLTVHLIQLILNFRKHAISSKEEGPRYLVWSRREKSICFD